MHIFRKFEHYNKELQRNVGMQTNKQTIVIVKKKHIKNEDESSLTSVVGKHYLQYIYKNLSP
jgi:hypothetical protein